MEIFTQYVVPMKRWMKSSSVFKSPVLRFETRRHYSNEQLPSSFPSPFQKTAQTFANLSFYRFTSIPEEELRKIQKKMIEDCGELSSYGRIYISTEGINAQCSVPTKNLEAFSRVMNSILPGFEGLSSHFNFAHDQSRIGFDRLHVRVRKQIVTAIDNSIKMDFKNWPQNYLDAKKWNKAMEDKENTVVVDVRNRYESEIGYFEGAVRPKVVTFRDSLKVIKDTLKGREQSKILMYCTGGIRCVKAAAFLKQEGFNNIFQLEGGIVNYAREVEKSKNDDAIPLESKFKGKNFVFDGRLAERITSDVVSNCNQCGEPDDSQKNCANESCHILFIQCPKCDQQMKGTCSEECKRVINLSPEEYRAHCKKSPSPNFEERKLGSVTNRMKLAIDQ